MSSHREIDDVTGVETTGHEWDGIKELNKPLPRWWLLSFYACIVWGIGYMIAYPAWPTLTGYTKGMLGYSQRAAVAAEVKAARSRARYRARCFDATGSVSKDPELLRFAQTAGGSAIPDQLRAVPRRGAQGFMGYPEPQRR